MPMSVSSVLIGLQASHDDGDNVSAAAFLDPFDIRPGDVESTVADAGDEAAGMIYFAVVQHSDFAHVDKSSDAGSQSEALFAGIEKAFRATARFLDQRSPEITASVRAAGLSLRMFIEIRMDQDQMELDFPPEFLAACGRHGLGVYVISNDIAAGELWETDQA
jgi:hypothetical protein